MLAEDTAITALGLDEEEPLEPVSFQFTDGAAEGITRRTFVQALGAGLLIAVAYQPSTAQERGRQCRLRGGCLAQHRSRLGADQVVGPWSVRRVGRVALAHGLRGAARVAGVFHPALRSRIASMARKTNRWHSQASEPG